MTERPSDSNWSSIGNLFRASWAATAGDRLRFFTFMFLFIAVPATDLIVPWVIGWTLQIFVTEGITEASFHKSLWGLGVYIALKMILAFLHHFARYLQETCAFQARFKKLEEIFSALISFPLKWHVHHHSGDNYSRLNRSVGAIHSLLSNYSWQILDGLVRFVLASLAIFTLDFQVAICVLIMGCASTILMVLFNRRLTRNIRKNNRFNDRLARTCVDYLYNIITVKTLKLEEPAVRYLTMQKDEGVRLNRNISRYQELKWASIGFGYSLVIGSSLAIYFHNHIGTGAFDIAKVYVLLDYLNRIFGSITSFTGYYSGVIEASIAYDDASSVINESEELKVDIHPTRLPANWRNVQMSGVDFSYTPGTKNLKSMNLNFRRGEKIALVGPSGGGKSTLLRVLAGMLQVSKAEIECDGVRNLDIEDIAGICLLIPQEPEIFTETVRYNLTLGQNFEQSELDRVMELCSISQILEKLPNGWDSTLEEAGLNLSVGERQRVALARGILRLKGKDVLLLDEPTSSLDPHTESKIFQAILDEYKDRTILMACHRLALVPLFDRIIYVREGYIEEEGSFVELKASGRGFSTAWKDYERNVTTADDSAISESAT